jgi:hypothetical protein
MWIIEVYNTLMQACIESDDFFTLGIKFLYKKILENQLRSSKKKIVFCCLAQRQNRQGFLRFYPLQTLISGHFFITVFAKPLQKGFTVF